MHLAMQMNLEETLPSKTHTVKPYWNDHHVNQTVKVSNTGSLLISCHKLLSFKLHFKGGSNSLVGSKLL